MPVGIVTGASRGLGLALVRELAERDWRVVVDARGADALRHAVAGLELARPGAATLGTVWCRHVAERPELGRPGMAAPGTARCRRVAARHAVARHDVGAPGTARHPVARPDVAAPEMAR